MKWSDDGTFKNQIGDAPVGTLHHFSIDGGLGRPDLESLFKPRAFLLKLYRVATKSKYDGNAMIGIDDDAFSQEMRFYNAKRCSI